MNKYLLIFFLSLTLLCSCSDDNAPADANENFITSVILTVGNDSYEAVINDGTITITVPYTVSLDGAVASFAYTPSAKIYPNPQEITDWNEERVFRVVSYNGDERQYTYTVIKDEIREDGDVVLKNAADITAFAEKGVSVINGNLTIGTESGEEITDIAALDNLKEVTGVISILDSYKGTDLTGLDNIKSVGGIKIGSSENYSNIPLYLFSLNSLEKVSGDINIYNNTLELVDFKNLPTVEGSVNIASANLKSIQAEKLTDIMGDFIISCDNNNAPGGTIKELSLPMLSNIGGTLSGTRFAELNAISFPELKTAGAIRFEVLPIELSKISFPEIETINGDLVFTSQTVYQAIGSSTSGNTSLIEFQGFSKLSRIEGTLTIANFTAIKSIPDISNATIGGLHLELLDDVSIIDLSNTSFISNVDGECFVKLQYMSVKDILGYSDMDCSFVIQDCYFYPFDDIPQFKNIDRVKDLYILSARSYPTKITASLKQITRNLHIDFSIVQNKFPIEFNNLTSIGGYMLFLSPTSAGTYNIKMPNLIDVGGQMYVNGAAVSVFDLSSLKEISQNQTSTKLGYDYSVTPNEFEEGMGLNICFDQGSDIIISSLERVGGNGMKINLCYLNFPIKSFSCPKLEQISNQLILLSDPWEDDQLVKLDFPTLIKVPKVQISNFMVLTDFSTFGTLFTNGQITDSSNWTITGCGYNPTFEDMKAGRYKPNGASAQSLSKKATRTRARVNRR